MKKLNTGCMPRTDFRYEEFEGLLGDFYLSLLPLKDSQDPLDQKDHQTAMQILNGFSKRYKIQTPEEAVKNPRAKEEWGKSHVLSNFSTLDMMSSFYRDFGVGAEPKTKDYEERCSLGRLILGVFDRHRIAFVGYEKIGDKKVPTQFNQWNEQYSNKTLAEVLAETL